MAVIGLGEKVRISQGYALQKSFAKDPSKKAKTMVLGAVPRVSNSQASLKARVQFAERAMGLRGRDYHSVMAAMSQPLGTCGGKSASQRRQEQYASADAKVASMRNKMSGVAAPVEQYAQYERV